MKSAVLSALLISLSACENKPPSYDATTGGNPQRGREAIVSYGCGACHKIDGIPNAYGLVGPSLQDIGARTMLGETFPTPLRTSKHGSAIRDRSILMQRCPS
jgi:cytochrome c